jgi:hypothetical protein
VGGGAPEDALIGVRWRSELTPGQVQDRKRKLSHHVEQQNGRSDGQDGREEVSP